MKASTFSEAQQAFILKQGADEVPAAKVPVSQCPSELPPLPPTGTPATRA